MDTNRLMRSMMQSMGMPFDSFFGMPSFGGPMMAQSSQHQHNDPFSSLLPHGFMSPMSSMMMDPFESIHQAMSMANSGAGGHGFMSCHSSVTSYTTDEHGRPQVYQQSHEVKQGPDGLKETKSSVRDSRTGHQELAIGHHLHDKAHIKKKSKNVYTGEEEQAEDLVNLEEGEAEDFERNWMQQARNMTRNHQLEYPQRYGRPNRLALTSGSHADHYQSQPTGSYPACSSKDKHLKKQKKTKKSKDDKCK